MGTTGTFARTATTPLRAGLSAGEAALEVALGIVRGARRALDGDGSAVPTPFVPPPTPGVGGSRAADGPQEDAGAEVRVEEPWDGYDRLTAAQIERRLSDADGEVAAAVSLYEASHRARTSVARAADRRLRALSG